MRWCLVLFLAAALHADGEEKPLPVERSRILHDRITYVVDGRQTIPSSVRITVSRGARILGRGSSAVLVVEGSLQIQGTKNEKVVLENLTIEPAPRFREIRLHGANLGKHAALRLSKDHAAKGTLVFDNSQLSYGAVFDVALCGGDVEIRKSICYVPLRIRGVMMEGQRRNLLSVHVDQCHDDPIRDMRGAPKAGSGGFLAGLHVSGANRVLVRNSRLTGARSEFRDCTTLTLDGNRFDRTDVVLDQKSFAKTKVQKCDFYGAKLVLKAAPRTRKQCVLIDKCWFEGLLRKPEIEEQVVVDGKDDDKCGAVAMFRQIKKQPLGLGG